MSKARNPWVRWYKFFWTTHKWIGILGAVVFLNLAVTGFLLLVKKDYSYLQPPTQLGAEGTPEQFVPMSQVLDVVLAEQHPAFQSLDDVDRVDFRPSRRVHKVHSVHDNAEIQVDAVTGQVLSVDVRRSDFIESLHDGSFFADWAHDYLMPTIALALVVLCFSGLYLWLSPIYRHRQKRKAARARSP